MHSWLLRSLRDMPKLGSGCSVAAPLLLPLLQLQPDGGLAHFEGAAVVKQVGPGADELREAGLQGAQTGWLN